jgi:putative ABC transport system permease protein
MTDRLWIAYDLRHAVRTLVRERGSVAPALLALSLGIGATTVIASVVHSVLIDAFPFEDHSRVVHFYIQAPDLPGRSAWYPTPEFLEYRAQNEVFSDVLGGASMEVLYSLQGATYRVRGTLIDPRALRALGVRPILGRDMTDDDGAVGAPPTFLMSDRMWAERFDRDPSVLGTTLELNGTMRTLIAVLPPRFLLQASDVFFPTTITAGLTDALVGRAGDQPLWVWTYARLKPGVTPEQAAANVEVIARRLAEQYPERYPERFGIAVVSLADAYTATSLKEMVYILVGAVSLLLMIACSNVANLLLARATVREKEFAVRASLGASRWRLVQQLLAESFVLAAAGTAFGGLLAFAAVRWVRAAIPATALPSEMEIRFSSEVLVATIAVTVFTTLLCGLAPALKAARGDLQRRLAGTGRGSGHPPGHGRWRRLLVAVQVTLAIVLLAGAGLMMRTLLALQDIDPGLNPENVLVGRFAVPQHQRAVSAGRSVFLERVTERIRALPGVVAVSPALGYPLEPGPSLPVGVLGTTPAEDRWMARVELVGNEYFRVVGLPLLSGRLLSRADVDGMRRVVVVNRRFAEDFLEGSDPIGRMASFGGLDQAAGPEDPSFFEIVGVVGDARNFGLQDDVRPQAFFPYTTPGVPVTAFALRSRVDPLSLQHAVREQIWAVDQGVALTDAQSLEDIRYRDALAEPSFGVGLLSSFAGIGLILAAIGVFSVVAYTVSLQTHEIGIRMALGAEGASVLRMIMLQGLRPILAGAAVGVGATYWLSRVMANQIYGVRATDPWTIGVTVVVLLAVGMVARLLPARRATKVNPQIALRHE